MLNGFKVLDLTSVLFGPYCTQLLSDLGAEVIKVEGGHGDVSRYIEKAAKTKGMGPAHIALNRNKKSVLLNLRDSTDRELMKQLISGSDIFIHNVRAAGIKRLGFDYHTVKQLNPSIIYIHCVGFGSEGLYAGAPAYDDVIQAASGATSLLPKVDGSANPRFLPSAIADKVAALFAANSAIAALLHRTRTGEGQFIEVPMLETFTDFLLKEHFGGLTFDPPTGPACYQRQIDPHRQPFPTKDGFVCIVPYAADSWDKVFDVLGDSEFLDDDRFRQAKNRFRNVAEIYRRAFELTPLQTTAYWIRELSKVDIPVTDARDISTILDEPHLKSVGFFIRQDHPTEGAHYQMKPPVSFGGYTFPAPGPAPGLGEHTEEVRARFAEAQSQQFSNDKASKSGDHAGQRQTS